MTRNLSVRWHDHPNSLVSFLQTLVNGNSLSDCTLAAEGKYVRAHKVILSACSPYFQLLFNQENDRNPIVILKDVRYECLKWVIDFVYLGEVQLRETQLKTFLEVARSLQIKGLGSSDNETVEKRSLSMYSKTRGSAFQSMESVAPVQVIDVDNDCKIERNVETRSTGQCRTPSPSHSEDARCITIESDAELDDSLDSDALEWSQGSAPPSVASSAPDSADTLLVNETQERNNLKSYNENSLAKDVLSEPNLEMEKRGVLHERSDHIAWNDQTSADSADTLLVNETQERNNLKSYNENSLAKDVLSEPNLEMEKRGVLCERNDYIAWNDQTSADSADTLLVNETQERNNLKSYNENSLAKDVLSEPNLEMEKRGVLCERNDYIEPSAQKKPASRRGVGRRASGSGRRAEGEASGLEVPPRGRASNPRRKRRSLKDMPKTIACPHCPKMFVRPIDLKVHNRSHTGERPYRCTTCPKRFFKASTLRRHTLVHTDERPFSCGACGKRFNRSCSLKIHLRIHTGERPYRCTTCQKRFVQACDLRRHTLVHTDERPFSCGACGKSFTHSGSLKIHSRIHTGERPYACPDCDKTFAAHSQLWAHKRSHSAGKYSCDACGRRFTRKALVSQHWVKAHGPGPRVVVTKLDGGEAK